ncbi:MAG: D-aminoacyl-tRNA deacylase [Phycisphaerae bacterium]|nr:D-aminoacyl-tRNA deacylase [Phycisphaerae bacterium]
MRAVVQRVSRAAVEVDGSIVGRIERGLLVYAAAAPDDSDPDVRYVADKIAGLRVFTDAEGKMNLSVAQVGGQVLLVSAFTVLADARKGRRPSFDASAPGPIAEPLVARLAAELTAAGLMVETGRFAAHMHVDAVNDGPICILLDSRRVI